MADKVCPHCGGHNIRWVVGRAYCNTMGCDESENGKNEIKPIKKKEQNEK